MNRLNKYIIKNLSILFLSIFLPLFAIASLIFLIKLATYTAVIQLTLGEMIMLYFFALPEVLFYTLPISFFTAAVLALFKLSTDNEMVVIFSLGIKPKVIIYTLLKPALLLSALLTFTFFMLMPYSKTLSKNFITYKKSEAKFNLSASEFGHSFGDWLLYIGENNPDGTYGNVFLFNKNNKDQEILVVAKMAKLFHNNGILRLELTDGEGSIYSKDEFSQINFKTMNINNTINTKLKEHKFALNYWKDDKKHYKRNRLITYILFTMFPLISLFLILSIGIVHIRHQKGKIYLYLFLSVAIFYGTTLGLQKELAFYTVPLVSITWLIVTYIIYRKTILTRF